MKKGKTFLGILAGASAGALMGILFAPLTGKDTRKKIANTSKEYSDTLKEKYDKTLDSISKRFTNVKEDVAGLAHHARIKEEKLKKEHGIKTS